MSPEPLVSTRNLTSGGDIGPLRRFTGVIDSIPTEAQTFQQEGGKPRTGTKVSLQVKDIEVLEAVEPYHLPVYTIQLSLSNRKKSRWGVLSESINAILDGQYTSEQLDLSSPEYIKPQAREDIDSLISKRVGFVVADGDEGRPVPPMLYDMREKKDVPTPTWIVYEIEGYGTAESGQVSPTDRAKELLDGKTQAQFNKVALSDPLIRNDPELLQAIGAPASSPKSFTAIQVAEGTFTKDKVGVFYLAKQVD